MPEDPILKRAIGEYFETMPAEAAALATLVKLAIDAVDTLGQVSDGKASLDRVKLWALAEALERSANQILQRNLAEAAVRALTEQVTTLIHETLERAAAPRPKVPPKRPPGAK